MTDADIEAIIKELAAMAESYARKNTPSDRGATLRGIAAIKHLQGKLLMAEAERLITQVARP